MSTIYLTYPANEDAVDFWDRLDRWNEVIYDAAFTLVETLYGEDETLWAEKAGEQVEVVNYEGYIHEGMELLLSRGKTRAGVKSLVEAGLEVFRSEEK